MRATFLFGVVGIFGTVSAFADPCTATLFEVGSGRKTPLFQFERKEKAEGTATRVEVSTKDLEGVEVVHEDATVESGKIRRYAMEQKQLGESGFIEVKGDKVHFSHTKAGKTKTSEEDLTDNLVVTGTLVDFIRAHWNEILKGETVAMRFGVVDRSETVGFKLFKIDAKKGEDVVVVKMKPSSFIIAAMVDPILLTFDKSHVRLVEVLGRTLAKRKVGDRWKDLDTDAVYQYPAPRGKS